MERQSFDSISTMGDICQALADPFTRARVDALIEQFRMRGVRMNSSNIIAALTDTGLHADAAKILAETVLARMGQRVAPLGDLAPQSGRCHFPRSTHEAVPAKSTRTLRPNS